MAAQARGSGVTMLRAAWRALSSVRAQAVAQAPGSALRGGGSASLPSARCGLQTPIVALTVRIRSYEEHMQKHRKDKAHKRHLLMSIDRRNKMLKLLRQTNYEVFEKACKELGVEYTIPPLHAQKVHRRILAKKALCIRVFQEVQKLKKQRKALKDAAAAAKKQRNQEVPKDPSQALPDMTRKN
ncbi:28S ribosomal protein S15, mitochondrial [Microtus ochrogaster]|uniref:Small ribosomal subunit protein uS15m n=1 Tax=Microtus ochrogaster TaxID=79684 RepID=A0A8J6G1U4_MICOH|nr:28S ribosomal protein S15, mitochondrial [Microtus ochrogaster]